MPELFRMRVARATQRRELQLEEVTRTHPDKTCSAPELFLRALMLSPTRQSAPVRGQ